VFSGAWEEGVAAASAGLPRLLAELLADG